MSGQKIYPDRGTDRRIVSTKSTCLQSPIRIFLSRPPRALCSDRADKSSVRPPVGVVFLARHSVRASNVSMASHGSMFRKP